MDQVLAYELQMRKEMVRNLPLGKSFKEALTEAMDNSVIKGRHFVTPLSVSAVARAEFASDKGASRWGGRPIYQPQFGKGKKGKGFGSYEGFEVPEDWKKTTPDGRPICFAYNNPREFCLGNCGRVNCCRICYKNHAAHNCTKEKPEDDKVVEQSTGGWSAWKRFSKSKGKGKWNKGGW